MSNTAARISRARHGSARTSEYGPGIHPLLDTRVLPTDKFIIVVLKRGCMKNILIVDDNKAIVNALSAALSCSLKDCGIVTAADGAKGMHIVESKPVDLIVTDLTMPVMNGYLFIENAKKHDPAIPVCVMTGSCAPHILEKLRSLGVSRWIEKPFTLDEFSQMIIEELNLEPRSARREKSGYREVTGERIIDRAFLFGRDTES